LQLHPNIHLSSLKNFVKKPFVMAIPKPITVNALPLYKNFQQNVSYYFVSTSPIDVPGFWREGDCPIGLAAAKTSETGYSSSWGVAPGYVVGAIQAPGSGENRDQP
jgi:hypothetical protein